MHGRELTIGRTFGVAFSHGELFFPALTEFLRVNNIRQGYIPMFIAGFSEADIVGTCEKVEDPGAPVWSAVHLTGVEALGCGTLAYDADTDQVLPHIHTTLGEKARSALGHTSHLLSATVQFLTEMAIVEVTSPAMSRLRDPALYDVPLLTFR